MQINLGQSQFQDTFFVAQAQLTPYRQLRQIELELRSIEDALMRGSFQERKLKVKISKLDPQDPEQAIEIDEANWDLRQQEQLAHDALARKANFEALKEELIVNVPKSYWDLGYEAAEAEHWVLHFSRKMAFEQYALGRPSVQTIEQVSLLPVDMQKAIALEGQKQVLQLTGTVNAETQVLPSPSKEA